MTYEEAEEKALQALALKMITIEQLEDYINHLLGTNK